MNRLHELRRLRWLLHVQEFLQQEKQRIMGTKLYHLNIDETAIEFFNNELARLLETEVRITELSYTYDFDQEPSKEEIVQYVHDMLGKSRK